MARACLVPIAFFALVSMHAPAHAIVGASEPAARAGGVMVLAAGRGRGGFCSGVALAPRIVLTAAHCVGAPQATRVHYRNGAGAPVLIEVARIERHAGYRANAVSARAPSVDLAMIETRDALPDAMAPSAIGEAPRTIGATLEIAGFGVMREGMPDTSGQFRSATLRLRGPLSNLLLWLEGEAGACTGDSGGPVFAGGALVAITAFAEGGGGKACGKLTQAVRLAPHRAWIESVIARWR